ncbi:LUC7 related protein [Rhynchospora pubera]|uniref:LUC7 related protein n=1 Tax=Rhynchospora pubera TaxID=906938 RepID=A0AAV8F1N1_9POAL|nr:LUC7 related protein [Rhynchospora pubera]
MDAQRALLDELMGAARNMTEDERKSYREIKWDDREVCGPYMVRFCPHDLFVNTKSNLGPCEKVHDLKLKESFEQSPRHDAFVPRFEADLAQFCEKLVTDLDKKVRRGRDRLAQELEVPTPPLSSEQSEQLSLIEEKIKKLLEQIEELGEAGKVDEAEALMRKVDGLNAEKTSIIQPNSKITALIQEKKMELCEICGSFLVANDAADRAQSHVAGKQHIGYSMIRDFLSDYKAAKEKAREEARLAREKEDEERRRKREEMEKSREKSEQSRERVRDQEREKSRDRDRDRDRENDRSRDRRGNRHVGYRNGRDNYDRERQRDRRGRDRSRSRSPIRRDRR